MAALSLDSWEATVFDQPFDPVGVIDIVEPQRFEQLCVVDIFPQPAQHLLVMDVAWAFISSEALAFSSALAAVRCTTLSISAMARFTWSMPWFCSDDAAAISATRAPTWPVAAATGSNAAGVCHGAVPTLDSGGSVLDQPGRVL